MIGYPGLTSGVNPARGCVEGYFLSASSFESKMFIRVEYHLDVNSVWGRMIYAQFPGISFQSDLVCSSPATPSLEGSWYPLISLSLSAIISSNALFQSPEQRLISEYPPP